MGKRSRAQTTWKRQREAATPVPARRTVRIWICADCRKPTQLIRCADGRQRCPTCKAGFDRRPEASVVVGG